MPRKRKFKLYDRRRTFDGVFYLSIVLFIFGLGLNIQVLEIGGYIGMLIKAVDR